MKTYKILHKLFYPSMLLYRLLPNWLFYRIKKNNALIMGVNFSNRVGFHAAADIVKNGSALTKLGYGFLDIGPITFKKEESLSKNNFPYINNAGVYRLQSKLQKRGRNYILGVRIQSNYSTGFDGIIFDYLKCMQVLYRDVDYLVFVFDKHTFDEMEHSLEIYSDQLKRLKMEQKKLTTKHKKYIPILVKIPLHLSLTLQKRIIEKITEFEIDGVVFNLTNYSDEIDFLSGLLNLLPDKLPVIFNGVNDFDQIKIQDKPYYLYLVSDLSVNPNKFLPRI